MQFQPLETSSALHRKPSGVSYFSSAAFELKDCSRNQDQLFVVMPVLTYASIVYTVGFGEFGEYVANS